jgi:hypothetical protein
LLGLQTEQVAHLERADEEAASSWLVPFNLSIDTLDKIVKACFRARADTEFVSLQDIANRAGVNARTVAPNLRFLASIRVLERDEAERKFKLSTKGTDYAKFLGSGDTTKAGEVLRELLPKSHLNELLGFTEVQGPGLTYDSLSNHIKTLGRMKVDNQGDVSSPFKSGIRTLISLLSRAAYVSSEILLQAETSKPSTAGNKRLSKRIMEHGGAESKVTASHISGGDNSGSPVALPTTINISIEAKDPESIKQVMELLRQLRHERRDEA